MESQAELIRRARDGDVDAFDALIHEHYADCLRYATRMLGNRADAEDVVQDSFVRAFHALSRYAHDDRFRPWLLRIVRNRCRSVAARSAWRLSALRRYVSEADTRVVLNGADLTTHDVERALAALPPKLREAFLLKHVEQLPYQEIAQITGASEAALKMRVKRACAALQALLGRSHRDG